MARVSCGLRPVAVAEKPPLHSLLRDGVGGDARGEPFEVVEAWLLSRSANAADDGRPAVDCDW